MTNDHFTHTQSLLVHVHVYMPFSLLFLLFSLSLSLSLSVEYNLESAESDTLLLNLLDQVEEAALDEQNHMERSSNRYPALFGLYPLPGREDALENRTPALPPSEHEGIKLLVKISELR